jgi:two-component system sensor histidine kinase/response regulator
MPDVRRDAPPRILVAEDHPTNQEVMRSLLRRLGYACTVAEDGVQTLAALEAEPDAFVMVLMDCQMPNMDGCEAARWIRARERELGLRRLPIVAVSASVFPEDRQRVADADMDGFLAKPLELRTLRAALEATLSDRVAPAVTEPMETTTTLAERARELLLIGGPELLADVRRLFVQEAERIGAALTDAFDADDHAGVRHLAHTLKGTSLNVGAPRLSDLARTLEVVARTGTLAGCRELLGALLAELSLVANAMQAAGAEAQ